MAFPKFSGPLIPSVRAAFDRVRGDRRAQLLTGIFFASAMGAVAVAVWNKAGFIESPQDTYRTFAGGAVAAMGMMAVAQARSNTILGGMTACAVAMAVAESAARSQPLKENAIYFEGCPDKNIPAIDTPQGFKIVLPAGCRVTIK
jgi:hypothetical protein